MKTTSENKKDTSAVISTREGSVFLVDDNAICNAMLASALKKVLPNVNVSCFSSGEQALQELEQKPFLMLLDYDLAGTNPDVMNGISVLKTIKKIILKFRSLCFRE